jgi:predicted RND superfamily exporter protein
LERVREADALLLLPSAYFAAKVRQDNSLDRLITATDPDYVATRDFQCVFGTGEFALLLVEADDPLPPAVIERVDRIERALRSVPLYRTGFLGHQGRFARPQPIRDAAGRACSPQVRRSVVMRAANHDIRSLSE